MAVDTRRGSLLRASVVFQQRAADAAGDPTGPWLDRCRVRARVVYLRGGETVMAERLQGKRPTVITIRYDSLTRLVDNGWRAVDARDGARIWDITATEPDDKHVWIDVLAEQQIGQQNAA